MKKIILFFINAYISFLSYVIKSVVGTGDCCRFSPTCSEYAKISISEKGVIKGTRLALAQFFKCQPFYKFA